MPRTDLALREVVATVPTMATTLTIRVTLGPDHDEAVVRAAVDDALQVVREVARTCTRFDPDSDLSRANATPEAWHEVSAWCLVAVAEAHAAYRRTGGRFDPRVLDDLVRLGYERSMTVAPPTDRGAGALHARPALPRWAPELRRASGQVRLGPHPVDLGGIGKGLAVRWAAQRVHGVGAGYLVDAGGDCACAGVSPDDGPWRVAVESPYGVDEPVAVLAVTDAAVATSSTRVRQWSVGGRPVHHLIDPRTGQPGGAGLLSVTTMDDDAATAEVWSKTLFLAGSNGIAESASHHGIAALWVDEEHGVQWSDTMRPHLLWIGGRS